MCMFIISMYIHTFISMCMCLEICASVSILYSCVDEHTDDFCVLAVVNNAGLNIGVHL